MLAGLHADWDSWKKTPPAKPRKSLAAGAKVLAAGAKKPVRAGGGRVKGGRPGG